MKPVCGYVQNHRLNPKSVQGGDTDTHYELRRETATLTIGDLLAGEKPENTSGAAKDTQDRAPILEALQTYLRANPTSFDVPGHQGGNAAPHSVTRLIGKEAFA